MIIRGVWATTTARETFFAAERSDCVEDFADHGRSISSPKHG
jgi:hypothetical protein